MTRDRNLWIGAFVTAAMLTTVNSALAQEVRLTFTSMSPAGSANSKQFNEWAQRINASGKGAVNVVVRDGTSLASFGNIYDRVKNDVVQIGWAINSLIGGQFPLTEVTSLPFLARDNAACSAALWRLYESGAVDKEYADIVPLSFNCFTASYLHWAKAPGTLESLKGAKFRASGKVSGKIIQLLGGTPISLDSGEMYEGLQRGTIDGVMTSWGAFVPYKLAEVTAFHVEAPLGTSPGMQFMWKAKFNALSKTAREALTAHSGQARSRELGAYFDRQAEVGRASAEKAGHEIVELTDEQTKAWKTKLSSVVDEWIAAREGGKRIVDMFSKHYADALAGK